MDRGEPPEHAVTRELREEVNLRDATAPEFLGLYVCQILWFSNFVAVYRLRGAIDFKPNFEITAADWFAPNALPPDTVPSARRRVAENLGAPRSPYW